MAQAWRPAQLVVGTTVYDVAGEKLGKLTAYDAEDGYVLIEKGFFFVKDIFAPLSAISSVDEQGIQLSLSKDELSEDRYASPPVATAGTASSWPATAATTTTRTVDTSARLATDGQDLRIPVREEELVAGTQRQEEGRVHIHKEVEEVPETVQVTLQKKRVTVERVPFSGDPAAVDEAFTERDLDVPVMGEEAVVGKRVAGVEEVIIHKDVVTETEQVSDTVRKERVVVDGVDDDGTSTRVRP